MTGMHCARRGSRTKRDMLAFDPAPLRLDDVLDPVWLAEALASRYPACVVTSVEVIETLVTQATKVRLIAETSTVGSLHLCVKGVLTDTGAPAAASLIETRFYRDLATRLPVRVPDCFHAGFSADGGNGVIVMDDVIKRGATFGSAMQPLDRDRTLTLLDQLARLHAATWQGTPLFASAAIPSFLEQIATRPLLPRDMLQGLLDGPRGEHLPASIRQADRLQAAVQALGSEIIPAPTCLVHGDAHAGNVYWDPDGVGLVDWQIFQAGSWAQDVAYTIAAVLLPEVRRAEERTLLDAYLDRLAAAGGPRIDRDVAWRNYRAAMVYGYFLWSITRKVEPEITNTFVRRLGIAVADLGSFDLLGA